LKEFYLQEKSIIGSSLRLLRRQTALCDVDALFNFALLKGIILYWQLDPKNRAHSYLAFNLDCPAMAYYNPVTN